MTSQTTPTPAAEDKPAWQRYLPAGAAATVAVAAIIGIQAAASDGSSTQNVGPGQGGPPSQAQQQAPGTSDGSQQQVPPWDQNGSGTPPTPLGMDGQAAPGATQGQQAIPDQGQTQDQGLASPRTNVS